MATDYQALRDALAAGPTPGPWHHDSDPIKGDPLGRVRFRVVALGRTIVQTYYSSEQPGAPFRGGEADNRYIAAASPDTIRALLDERDALREALRLFQRAGIGNSTDFEAQAKAFDAARAALATGEDRRGLAEKP